MKKALLTVVLALASVVAVNGQLIGLKGGMNLANLGGDVEGTAFKPGLHLGAFVEFKVTEMLKIQPEVLFSAQGAQSDQNYTLKYYYNYLNVPLIAKVFLIEGFNIQMGPQVGFLLSAEFSDGNTNVDFKDFTKSTDFSVGLGIGYQEDKIDVSARYNLGLTNIDDSDDVGDYTENNQVIQLSIGFIFNRKEFIPYR